MQKKKPHFHIYYFQCLPIAINHSKRFHTWHKWNEMVRKSRPTVCTISSLEQYEGGNNKHHSDILFPCLSPSHRSHLVAVGLQKKIVAKKPQKKKKSRTMRLFYWFVHCVRVCMTHMWGKCECCRLHVVCVCVCGANANNNQQKYLNLPILVSDAGKNFENIWIIINFSVFGSLNITCAVQPADWWMAVSSTRYSWLVLMRGRRKQAKNDIESSHYSFLL